ncbi:hypothetical protein JMG10_13965 [Nostoc ellipsosporum NOK]|nr:hypothetical protein [Nostoc ellipsosporum NOK]
MRYAFVSIFFFVLLSSEICLAQRAGALNVSLEKGKESVLFFPNQFVKPVTPDTPVNTGRYIPVLFFDDRFDIVADGPRALRIVEGVPADQTVSLMIDTGTTTSRLPMTLPAAFDKKTGSENYYLLRYFDFQQRRSESGEWKVEPPSYYINYGHKYLLRFKNETREMLSPDGKRWLDQTLINLQLAVEEVLVKNPSIEMKDERFNDLVYATHAGAYEKAGFVKLGILDKVKIALTPDASDLFDPRGMALIRQMSKKQFAYYRSHPFFAMRQAVEFAANMGEIMMRVIRYAVKYGVDRKEVLKAVKLFAGL